MSVRSKVSVTAVFLSALSLHAAPSCCRPSNSFEQGYELRQNQMMAAYNATARIDVRGSWDVYTTGGYIFWQPREENLELGIRNDTVSYIQPIDGRVINMNYRYKSGFKAGLGVLSEWDNWDAYAQYIWLCCHQRTHAMAPTHGEILPFWGHPANVPSRGSISEAKGRWRLGLSIIDAQLARSYYVGTKLTFKPYFGGRCAWINQKYTAAYTETSDLTYRVRNSSHSWGVGPEAGLTGNWLLGYGFRAIGSVEADVLYTRYNLFSEEQSSSDPTVTAVSLYQRHLGYLRPHMNLEFGFGAGSYFSNHNYHFDLLATYGFQVFWSQNMFRNFVDDIDVGKSYAPNGDLYVHGVTGELRFDF